MIRLCWCGCGERVKKRFSPGHNKILRERVKKAIESGSKIDGLPIPTTDPVDVADRLGWEDLIPTPQVEVKGEKDFPFSFLGHDIELSDLENTFKLHMSFLTDADAVVLKFVDRCARYPAISGIFKVFREEYGDGAGKKLYKFLNIYSGVSIYTPDEPNEENLRLTHWPDILEVFGEGVVSSLMEEFGCDTIKVPPGSYLKTSMRDTDVLCSLDGVDGDDRKNILNLLAIHYDMTRVEIQRVARRLGV